MGRLDFCVSCRYAARRAPRGPPRQSAALTPGPARAAAPLDQEIASSGLRGKADPAHPARRHRSTRRRQDAPDLPKRKISPRTIGKTYTAPDGKVFRPVDVPHPDLPQLRPGQRGRHPGRPGRLRLPAGGTRRAALRRAVRPVHPEPAPRPRLRRAVLRRHRTPAPPRPARAHRHARHHLPLRAAPDHRRHLPPGLVARHRRVRSRASSCRSGTSPRRLPRPRHRRAAAHLG